MTHEPSKFEQLCNILEAAEEFAKDNGLDLCFYATDKVHTIASSIGEAGANLGFEVAAHPKELGEAMLQGLLAYCTKMHVKFPKQEGTKKIYAR